MSVSNRVFGTFTLASPLFCAAPNEDASDRKNHTYTMTQPVMTRNGRQMVPFFPGNDLRGQLRRAMARRVLDAVTSGGQKVDLGLYTAVMCGGKDTSPEQDLTVEEALRARAHIYMGVCGGGKRLLRSGYVINDLVPVIGATVEAGMVPAFYAELSEQGWLPTKKTDAGSEALKGYELTHERQMLRVDDAYRVLDVAGLDKYVENACEVVSLYQIGVTEARAGRKDQKAANAKNVAAGEKGVAETDKIKKSDVGNIYTTQAISPGTRMYFLLDMSDAFTAAQRGLLLQALSDLVNQQSLGGFVRNGWGRYVAELTAVIDGESSALFIRKDDGSYALSGAFDAYIEAMHVELASLTVDGLLSFFESRQKVSKDGDK